MLVEDERRRRGISTTAIVREALAAHLTPPSAPKCPGFVGVFESMGGSVAANDEAYLARHWAADIAAGLQAPHPDTPQRFVPLAEIGSDNDPVDSTDAGNR